MRRIALFALLIGFSLSFAFSQQAHAQATRTWVSGVGDDVNPCSRTAPCKTFAGAISKTAAGGEINCLDAGGFGTLTITKAISILCEGVVGGVLAAGTNGFNVIAAATDHVLIRGLDFDGVGSGLIGINITQAASVTIDHCQIRNFNSGAATGISFVPTNFNSILVVRDTVVTHNGTAAAGSGILVNSTAGIARASIIESSIHQNFTGVSAQNQSSTQINASLIAGNTGTGVAQSGAASVYLGRSVIANNLGSATTGSVLSYLDNQINNNNPDTAPTSAGGYK